uniref:SCP domain-containing protein n=1 Tax=Strongyloides venezuelensis TaxID=75913 RepID=A0A0K0FCW4_STRVS
MHIFNTNYYITFIILSTLFYQYKAFESNVKSDDNESLNLFKNDLLSKNIIKHDSIISFLNRNDETNYLQKRQASLKSAQKKSKKTPSRKPSQSKITTRKNPLSGKTTPKKTTPRKATPGRTTPRKTIRRKTTQKSSMQKTTHKAPPKSKTTTKKPTTKKTKSKKKPKVTTTTTTGKSKTSKPVTRKPLPVKPVVTTSTTTTGESKTSKTLTTKPLPVIPVVTTSTTTTTTTSVTTTEKPDDLNKFVEKTIDDINTLRAKFNRKPLEVDNKLAMEAQNYSNIFVVDVSKLEPYENDGRLQYICSRQYLADFDAVKYWTSNDYDEIIDNSEEKFQYPAFGQLIAKKSTNIGCGINKTKEFTAIFCRIQPTFDLNDEYYEEEVEDSLGSSVQSESLEND